MAFAYKVQFDIKTRFWSGVKFCWTDNMVTDHSKLTSLHCGSSVCEKQVTNLCVVSTVSLGL